MRLLWCILLVWLVACAQPVNVSHTECYLEKRDLNKRIEQLEIQVAEYKLAYGLLGSEHLRVRKQLQLCERFVRQHKL